MDIIKDKNKFIEWIVWKKFKYLLSEGQIEIVRKIAFRESKKISISAMTQYGKSFCVTIGLALLLDDDSIKVKIAFIGPKDEQAHILREYLTELIFKCPSLLNKAQLSAKGEDRLVKEASRKRMTFSNGSQYRVFSAEGEANRLMGFGVGITDGIGIVVKDEACLIPKTANAKIGRMMGNNPDDCMQIELYNPWSRDNLAFDHTLLLEWDKIQIGWEQAVKEKRTTQLFVDDQRKDLTPLEFTVLYDSEFPDQSTDSLFSLKKIKEAENRNYDFEMELQKLERKLGEAHKLTESELRKVKEEMKKYKRIISTDPADKGLDETVVYWGTKKENKYQLVGYYSEPKTESMNLVGIIIDKAIKFIGRIVKGTIILDRIGIGTGPLSRIKEVIREKNLKNVNVIGAHFGESALKKDHFANKKAENYFRLASLFEEGMISILIVNKLRSQLISMKWDLTSSAKRKIIDPDDSPDFSDNLVFFVWKDNTELEYTFI